MQRLTLGRGKSPCPPREPPPPKKRRLSPERAEDGMLLLLIVMLWQDGADFSLIVALIYLLLDGED